VRDSGRDDPGKGSQTLVCKLEVLYGEAFAKGFWGGCEDCAHYGHHERRFEFGYGVAIDGIGLFESDYDQLDLVSSP
jgi:hypothetical protein